MDERLTNFYVDYNIEDTTAKTDALFNTEDEQQYFTNITRLIHRNENLKLPRFTFEHNFNVLDGSLQEMELDSDNLYSFTNASLTTNSVIFVESTDTSITASSSSMVEHETASYSKTLSLEAGTYYISGCPSGGRGDTYNLTATVDNTVYTDRGAGFVLTLENDADVEISCNIMANYYAEDVTFYPVVSTHDGPYIHTVVPYFNTVLSDNNGEWETNPSIVITFSREHASFAFVARFLDDHPLEMKLDYFNLDGLRIASFTEQITSNNVNILHDVYGYAKIVIQFTKALPYRYVKFISFIFGIVITWDETNVKQASMVQATDRISKNISIDTLSFTVIDEKGDLNLGNTDGMHKYFQRNQYMLPYEEINGKIIKLGKFYLKTFSEKSNLGKMTSQSYLGRMDDITFYDGEVYNGKQAGKVLEQIFATMGLTDYIIDNETYNTLLFGTIAPKTCRKALNDVLFATHSIVDSHDLDNFIIKKTGHARMADIPRDKKFSTSTKKIDYTYGVEVKYTQYVKKTERTEVAKGTYEAGTHTIYFNAPYEDLILHDESVASNLMTIGLDSGEENGVIYGVTETQILIDGTCTQNTDLELVEELELPAGTYVLSDNYNSPTENDDCCIVVESEGTVLAKSNYAEQRSFTLESTTTVSISLKLLEDSVYTAKTIEPLLRNMSDIKGIIDEQSPYYVTLTLTTSQEISITGYGYDTTQSAVRYVQSKLQAGEGESIKTYTTTLCNMATAKLLAMKLLEYAQFDMTINLKWLATDNKMDEFHVIQNPNDQFTDYYGMYTKRTLDLTGGFIDTAELVGSTVNDNQYLFTKRETDFELIAGEDGII